MGISGLLPFLKKASKSCHVRQFSGHTVAVDAYCWLHKGAFGCADKLGKGEPTTAYVTYCLKYVNTLLANGIKPVLVFDGRSLPAKAVTNNKRRERRQENRIRAKQYLKEGKTREAWECFTKCVEITPAMTRELIKSLRQQSIDYIIAPYEADAQLAYLARKGIVDLVITEDSDLVLFGCPKILFKMTVNGDGVLFDQAKIPACMGVRADQFQFERFRRMCILSGCDYLPSLHGIGLVRAKKVFTSSTNTDIRKILKSVPKITQLDIEVPEKYIQEFIQAENTFLFQLVFDPTTRCLMPLTPYPPGINREELAYAGSYENEKLSLDMALGNVDVKTLDRVDAFDLDQSHSGYNVTSIWSPRFIKTRNLTDKRKEPNHSSTAGLRLSVNMGSLVKKQPADYEGTLHLYKDTSERNIISIYKTESASQPQKEEILDGKQMLKGVCRSLDNDEDEELYRKDFPKAQVYVNGMVLRNKRKNPFLKSPEMPVGECSESSSVCTVSNSHLNMSPVCVLKKLEDEDLVIVKSKYFKPADTCFGMKKTNDDGKYADVEAQINVQNSRLTRNSSKRKASQIYMHNNQSGEFRMEDMNQKDSLHDSESGSQLCNGSVDTASFQNYSMSGSESTVVSKSQALVGEVDEDCNMTDVRRITSDGLSKNCSTRKTRQGQKSYSCRRQGLSKNSKIDPKQKSLKEMFAYQKKPKLEQQSSYFA